ITTVTTLDPTTGQVISAANEVVARIRVGDPQAQAIDQNGNPAFDGNGNIIYDGGAVFDAPRAVAMTSDNGRAYVTLRSSHSVAVIDTLMLQQIDAVRDVTGQAATLGVNVIDLPSDARPFWIAIDDKQQLAFVGDEVTTQPLPGRIYVIDIDPASRDYNKLVGTLTTRGPTTEYAPFGLRGMIASSADGQLIVAAPG